LLKEENELEIKIIKNMNFEIMNILPMIITLVFIVGCIILFNQYLEKKNKKYEKYLESIKVGDIFESNLIEYLDENPFDDNVFNRSDYQYVITDIRKNSKGETWVKYKKLRDNKEDADEIHDFAEDKTRI
jgi:hypothetical protein